MDSRKGGSSCQSIMSRPAAHQAFNRRDFDGVVESMTDDFSLRHVTRSEPASVSTVSSFEVSRVGELIELDGKLTGRQ